jgi:ABC-type tungstate transport system substrate-binding protein
VVNIAVCTIQSEWIIYFSLRRADPLGYFQLIADAEALDLHAAVYPIVIALTHATMTVLSEFYFPDRNPDREYNY